MILALNVLGFAGASIVLIGLFAILIELFINPIKSVLINNMIRYVGVVVIVAVVMVSTAICFDQCQNNYFILKGSK